MNTRRFWKRALPCLIFCASLRAAQPPARVCRVAPLPAITDPEASAFENSTDSAGPIDTGGLMPAMARALERFRELVDSVGGKFELKSAYRPPAYQAHLQEVWYKWMELRRNLQSGCRALRAEVKAEFERHNLMESQKPVSSSDHTRGLAFDAVVVLPRLARLRRSGISLDRLARLAGITRPDIRRDPVHFKLAAGTQESAALERVSQREWAILASGLGAGTE